MIGETVVLQRWSTTGTNAYGNEIATFTDQVISGAVWQPGQTSEATQGAEETTADARCYLPAGTAVSPLDRIVRAGETFEVQGERSDWTSPWTSVRAPVMVRVRRVQGVSAHSVTSGGAA